MSDKQEVPPNPFLSASSGISLRDLFAASALIGFLAGETSIGVEPEELAHDAWKQADAMLKERAK